MHYSDDACSDDESDLESLGTSESSVEVMSDTSDIIIENLPSGCSKDDFEAAVDRALDVDVHEVVQRAYDTANVDMTVPQLKARLQESGHSMKGKKAVFQKRLRTAEKLRVLKTTPGVFKVSIIQFRGGGHATDTTKHCSGAVAEQVVQRINGSSLIGRTLRAKLDPHQQRHKRRRGWDSDLEVDLDTLPTPPRKSKRARKGQMAAPSKIEFPLRFSCPDSPDQPESSEEETYPHGRPSRRKDDDIVLQRPSMKVTSENIGVSCKLKASNGKFFTARELWDSVLVMMILAAIVSHLMLSISWSLLPRPLHPTLA